MQIVISIKNLNFFKSLLYNFTFNFNISYNDPLNDDYNYYFNNFYFILTKGKAKK